MPEPRWLNRDELNALLDQAKERLADYGAGFVRIERSGLQEDAMLAGSGTLVKVDDVHAILTADHVLTHLPSTGEIGLVLNLRPEARAQRYTINMQAVRPIRIGEASNDAEGPDLAAIVLPPSTAGEIVARASFYDLPGRRERMLNDPPPLEHKGWVICGFVDERTTTGPEESGFRTMKLFNWVTGGADVASEEERGGFDYLDFRVKHDAGVPVSFAGVSGGAIWRVFAKERDGVLTMAEPLLTGVAFFQIASDSTGRSIVCHGRRSIYRSALDAIRAAA